MALSANARIDVGVINDHLEKLIEPGMRSHIMLAKLRKRGRIKYNCHSDKFDWRVKFRRNTPVENDDMQANTFPRVNRHKKAELDYRSYILGESFTKFERLASQDPKTALINIVGKLSEFMASDFNEFFPLELYNDGHLNTGRIHGLETMFSHTGTVVTNSPAYAPNDIYADLDCTLNAYGGSWTPGDSNGYPLGQGSLEYHFWSPLILDEEAAFWSASDKTWAGGTWREALRFADTYQQTLHSKTPDLWLMTPEKLRLAKETLTDKERIIITTDTETMKLGFKVLNWEGTELLSEYGVPADACYGLRFDSMELRSMQSKLFMADEAKDLTFSATQLSLDFYGTMKFTTPADFVKVLK